MERYILERLPALQQLSDTEIEALDKPINYKTRDMTRHPAKEETELEMNQWPEGLGSDWRQTDLFDVLDIDKQ